MPPAKSIAPDNLVLSNRDDNDVVTLTMSRPRVNALNLEMLELLRQELAAALATEARAIVLTGANACFCAGLDTRALAGYDAEERRRTVDLLNRLTRDLYGAPIPTVAAVSGHALAGGMIFALACDRRLVTTTLCKLGLPEVQAGVPYPEIPRIVAEAELGPRLTRTLVLDGEPLTPQEAVECGVFDATVEGEELEGRARSLATRLAGHPGYSRIKTQFRSGICLRADEIIHGESDPMLQNWL